jgi:hypothetical protein
MIAQAGNESIRQADFARKRQDAAHRRYLTSIGALATIRKLLPAGVDRPGVMAPPASLRECQLWWVMAPKATSPGRKPASGRAGTTVLTMVKVSPCGCSRSQGRRDARAETEIEIQCSLHLDGQPARSTAS